LPPAIASSSTISRPNSACHAEDDFRAGIGRASCSSHTGR
jgi:hypothetical protein